MGSDNVAWWKGRTKGIYTYGISPFYQRAYAGFFRKELPQLLYGGLKNALIIGPIMLLGVGVVKWANYNYHHRNRKPVVENESESGVAEDPTMAIDNATTPAIRTEAQ